MWGRSQIIKFIEFESNRDKLTKWDLRKRIFLARWANARIYTLDSIQTEGYRAYKFQESGPFELDNFHNDL